MFHFFAVSINLDSSPEFLATDSSAYQLPLIMCGCCGLITNEKQSSWSRNYLELDKQNSKHLKPMNAFKNFGNKTLGNLSIL